jgi:multidrug efflux system membrane fusion protein
VATVEQDRAAVDEAQLRLSYATIKAPVAGRIGHIEQQVGNMIYASARTPLTTLNVLDPIEVSFAVPEQQLELVQTAMAAGAPQVRATRTGDAPIDVGGALTFIDNAADASTGTIRLRARFANSTRVLWPGQFVTATLTLPGEHESIVVPNAAIANGPDGTYVYVVAGQSSVEQRAGEVARAAATWANVDGVEVGELVVVDGQMRLYPGARVVIRAADTPT